MERNLIQKDIHKKIIGIMDSVSPGSLLDIPCGSGVLSKYFDDKGFDVYSADINPNVLKIDAKKFKKADLNGRIPFDDDFFDYCLSIEGIEHTFNPDNVIKELSRVLKWGGGLYLSAPNVCRLRNRAHYFFTGISDIIEPAPLPVTLPHDYGLHVSNLPLPLLDYFLRKYHLQILEIFAIKYHSSFYSKLLRPIIKQKMKRAYKKCRDVNADKVAARLEKFMLSDEILNGEGLIIKARKHHI